MNCITKDNDWPYNCIDWDEAAELLQNDYTSIMHDGRVFWIGS